MVEVVITITDLLEDLLLGVALKGKISADERVEDNPERPQIRLLAVVALDHFWCHIVGCSRYLRQTLPGMCRRRQSEIDQAHRVLLSNHDIVWLDVSVDHILRMTMVNRLKELLHISSCCNFCECLVFLLYNFLVHWHSLDILHDEIDVFLIVVSFIILDNVGMVESVERGDLVVDII